MKELLKYLKTQRKLLELAQARSLVLDKINEAVAITDEHFLVKNWNKACEKMYGYTEDEVCGKRMFDVLKVRESERSAATIEELSKFDQWNGEFTFFNKQSEPITTLVSYGLIRDSFQRVTGAICVMHDISERKKIELSLLQTNQTLEALLSDQLNETKEANTKLRELSQKMQATREDERLRISRELHDDLGQLLTSAKIYLGFIGEELNIQDERLKKNFESVVNTLDQSIASIRNIAHDLRPIVLRDIGLFEAIRAHCKRIEKETAIPVEVLVNIEYLHIEKDAALHLFRIFQESVNNVIKHATASKITVTIDKENNQLILQVVDNGQGFDINLVRNNSLGLKTMKERANLINGQYFIQSNPGKGTAVKVSVPMDQLI